jgi:hypothetical protein
MMKKIIITTIIIMSIATAAWGAIVLRNVTITNATIGAAVSSESNKYLTNGTDAYVEAGGLYYNVAN